MQIINSCLHSMFAHTVIGSLCLFLLVFFFFPTSFTVLTSVKQQIATQEMHEY